MRIKQIAGILGAFFIGTVSGFAQEKAPALSLSKAAKIAEEAITSGSYSADCFLRSITLIQNPDSAPFYRVTFKPSPGAAQDLAAGQRPTMDVMVVGMDGKTAIIHEPAIPVRRRTMVHESDSPQRVVIQEEKGGQREAPKASPPEKLRPEISVGLDALGDFDYAPAEKAFHFSYQKERYWFHIGRVDPEAKPETGLLLLQLIRACKMLRIQALAEPVNGSVVVTSIVCVY